jgi:hypothetical protein
MSDDKNPNEWTTGLTDINQPFILFMVSDAGFEPATPAAWMSSATGLAFSFLLKTAASVSFFITQQIKRPSENL